MTLQWLQVEIQTLYHSQGSSWPAISLPFQQHPFQALMQSPAILRNSEVFEDHNRVGTFHMCTVSNHRKILSRELKLCELCLRKISLGKLYIRPCSKKKKKKCWQLIAALVCCYICSDKEVLRDWTRLCEWGYQGMTLKFWARVDGKIMSLIKVWTS